MLQRIPIMALEAFIDIRFGDPVSSLHLNPQGLAYGTMIGRVLYYDLNTQKQHLISQISEEYIPGIHLLNGALYAAIGDLKVLFVPEPMADIPIKQNILHDRLHNSISCELTQIKMHEDSVLLFTLQPEPEDSRELLHALYLTSLSTQIKRRIEGIPFSNTCMPFDFDGHRLLWMDWNEDHQKILNIFSITEPAQNQVLGILPADFGDFSFARLIGQQIVFVHEYRHVRVTDISDIGNVKSVGKHDADVVALSVKVLQANIKNPNRVNSDIPDSDERIPDQIRVAISVDMHGKVMLWNRGTFCECLDLRLLSGISEEYRYMKYFAMGYPYFVDMCGSRIALSTDLGVLVVYSQYLASLSGQFG